MRVGGRPRRGRGHPAMAQVDAQRVERPRAERARARAGAPARRGRPAASRRAGRPSAGSPAEPGVGARDVGPNRRPVVAPLDQGPAVDVPGAGAARHRASSRRRPITHSAADSASRKCSPGSASRPSMPSRVETIGRPLAMAISAFSREPPPVCSGSTSAAAARQVRPLVGDVARDGDAVVVLAGRDQPGRRRGADREQPTRGLRHAAAAAPRRRTSAALRRSAESPACRRTTRVGCRRQLRRVGLKRIARWRRSRCGRPARWRPRRPAPAAGWRRGATPPASFGCRARRGVRSARAAATAAREYRLAASDGAASVSRRCSRNSALCAS